MKKPKKLLVVGQPVPAHGERRDHPRGGGFCGHLPDEGWEPSVLTARAEGPAAEPPGVRVAQPRCRGPGGCSAAAAGAPGSTAGSRCPTLLRLGRAGRAHGPAGSSKASGFDVIMSSSPRPSVHLVAAGSSPSAPACRGSRTTATRVHVPVPAVPDSERTGRRHEKLEGLGSGPGCRRDGGQPAHRRRPSSRGHRGCGRAHVLPYGFEPRRAARGRLARRGLLDRAYRPPVRARAAGGRVPRGTRHATGRRQALSSASTRAACARTPTGSDRRPSCA